MDISDIWIFFFNVLKVLAVVGFVCFLVGAFTKNKKVMMWGVVGMGILSVFLLLTFLVGFGVCMTYMFAS